MYRLLSLNILCLLGSNVLSFGIYTKHAHLSSMLLFCLSTIISDWRSNMMIRNSLNDCRSYFDSIGFSSYLCLYVLFILEQRIVRNIALLYFWIFKNKVGLIPIRWNWNLNIYKKVSENIFLLLIEIHSGKIVGSMIIFKLNLCNPAML